MVYELNNSVCSHLNFIKDIINFLNTGDCTMLSLVMIIINSEYYFPHLLDRMMVHLEYLDLPL